MKVNPFRALRPVPELAAKVAALPYDVMNADEAREMVAGNPYSFLHIDKAEIDLAPGVDPYCGEVYDKAAQNLGEFESKGVLTNDPVPCYYLYRLTMNGVSQTGFVGCASVDGYLSGDIKKHELTRAAKEADRIRHVDRLDANTGPIYLAHRPDEDLAAIKGEYARSNAPIYDFLSGQGVRHQVWKVDDAALTERIRDAFGRVPSLYIADGHHRCASAVKVAQMRRESHPGYTGDEEFNYFLAVIFPSDELHIMAYNRAVKDLNGMDESAFIDKVRENFDVEALAAGHPPFSPSSPHEFGMFAKSGWHRLTLNPGSVDESSPVGRLDVSMLQERLLGPVLGIGDPRSDSRIDFIGGIRGPEELERRVAEDMEVAFSMYPTSIEELMSIADAGQLMPPKSTWFEPKLLSGLFIHRL